MTGKAKEKTIGNGRIHPLVLPYQSSQQYSVLVVMIVMNVRAIKSCKENLEVEEREEVGSKMPSPTILFTE